MREPLFARNTARIIFSPVHFVFSLLEYTRRNENSAFFLDDREVGGLKNPLRCAALHIVSYAPQSVFSGRPGPASRLETGFHSPKNNWKTTVLFCFFFSGFFLLYSVLWFFAFFFFFTTSAVVFHFSNTKG